MLLTCCARPAGEPRIVAGNARFEFLTPSLVRMEYASSGKFVDAPTAVVQKRDWAKIPVQSTQGDGWLTARTSAMTVHYRLQSGAFSATNLEITWTDSNGRSHNWHPGDKDTLNLGGMPYSLDNISQDNLPPDQPDTETPVNDIIPGIEFRLEAAQPGLLSRAGYAFIDDSRTPVWDGKRAWIEPRQPADGQDWYLFTYQDDYRRVLREYAQLCGPIPMVPRYALEPMITDLNFEYFPQAEESRQPDFQGYNQQRLEEEVARLGQERIPVGTLVLDFAWHNYGWDGGYDWSPLIPHPEQLIPWLHDQGIKLSLNDHPGYVNTDESILSFKDSHAPQVLRELRGSLYPSPTFDMDVSRAWTFAPDPRDQGLTQHWYAPRPEVRWKPIRIGLPWQEQDYAGYQGIGWYRAQVRLPAQLPEKIYLYLGEVKKTYRIFINGKEAVHSRIRWPQRLTYTDLTPYVLPGRDNEIVFRVEPGEDAGGLLLGPAALRNLEPPDRIHFDLSNQQQADVFMRDLHGPLMKSGVDFWWVDGGSGATDMPGLNPQLWTNKVFYDYSQKVTQRRGFILGRYGDWGSERYPAFFTGDTYSQWPVLAYEVAFTARGGNVLVAYISHDVGGFHGRKIDFDLYARWIEFATFSPILRMHSAHANPREGNVRMPWLYGDAGVALMKKYFTLRMQLMPYLYTYTWVAHRDAVPILRPLYMRYPRLEEAYRHSREYFFGDEMLVAPITEPGGNQTVYLPEGQWLDFFTGKRYAGNTTFTAQYATDETPVFVREGSIVPERPTAEDSGSTSALLLNVYGSGAGRFDLYEDDGISLAYEKGEYAETPLTYTTDADGTHHLRVEPTKGSFQGQASTRNYELHIHGGDKAVRPSVDGKELQSQWDAEHFTASVTLPAQSIRKGLEVTWR